MQQNEKNTAKNIPHNLLNRSDHAGFHLPCSLLMTHLSETFFPLMGCHFMAFTFLSAGHGRPPFFLLFYCIILYLSVVFRVFFEKVLPILNDL